MMWVNLEDQQSLDLKRIAEIMALDPNYYLAHICRGICLAFQSSTPPSDLAEAIAEINTAIDIDPQQWDHYFWKGIIYGYRGDPTKAMIALNAALAKDIPPMLLRPLYWFETASPGFFASHLLPLLNSIR